MGAYKWFWTAFYSWKYKFVDPELCCCGVVNCKGDFCHSPRSAKEYAITSEVEAKISK